MGKVTHPKKREKAFRLRLEKMSLANIARDIHVSVNTVSKWENGWVAKNGRRYKGWKEELERLWQEQEDQALQSGLMLKNERLKAYDKLARMVIEKIETEFPEINAKTPADVKALMSEVRELCRLIAIEKGEYAPGGQSIVAVKTDISLSELQERFNNARRDTEIVPD
jgi:DNA-binding XRE family transcriptional regulator